jgi:hypothetical protein
MTSSPHDNEESQAAQACPICGKAQRLNARYPRYLCRDCGAQATDESGRRLQFRNAALTGRFEAVYADTGDLHPSNVCFVRGIRCWADEARFGGIVIQTQDATNVASSETN